MSVLDTSKLPSGLRVQMVWAPETNTDPEDRPIALVRDSKPFWISTIPMLIAFLVGSGFALLTTQRLLLIPPLAVFPSATSTGSGAGRGTTKWPRTGAWVTSLA